jgi:hypothetical protein
MTATEAEVTAVHPPGTQLAAYTPGQVEEYRPRIVMDEKAAKALDDQLRACMLAVLRPGVDYGTIPGMGDKPSLFKPGAEKLIQWFGFGFTSERGETERDSDGNRLGVTYRCTVTKGLPDGRTITIATCEGYAGYDEDRFYTSPEQAVAKAAKAKAREEYNAAKYNRAPNPAKWQFITEYRAPWNTVIKMAQKRAHVGAAIDATAAAGLFTQDLEDMTPPPGRDDENGSGTGHQPADEAWENSTPAPPRQNRTAGNGKPARQDQPDTPAGDSRPWAKIALEQAKAGTFKTEAGAWALWREAAEPGKCTPKQKDEIQNNVAVWIKARRREASGTILRQLPEAAADWRAAVEGLNGDDIEACREALEEIGRLKGEGTMNEILAGRIGGAIIALCPKAAYAGDDDA